MAIATGTLQALSNAIGFGAANDIATRVTGTITETFPSLTATTITTTGLVRTGLVYGIAGHPKVGTTAGWTVGTANNIGPIATVAASQTACTLVVPVNHIKVDDTITAFGVYASINSAGGAVTLDANLRKLVYGAAASATDSSIGSITQISVSTATAATAQKTGLTEVVAAGSRYYVLLTATTAASTTIELDHMDITFTTA